ncbi:MAG: M23 family metallopeptidase [Clostridia bacterium]|nr:M23 family metallopeptidase [Clostridia bacterium]
MSNESKNKRLPGFYIALCCCVLVIGVAGYFTERQNAENKRELTAKEELSDNTGKPEGEIISVSEIKPVEDTSDTPADDTSDASTEAPSATEIPEYTKDNPDVMAAVTQTETAEESFSLGEINVIAPYSSVLSFNEALGDYRTHNGIDIAYDEGCSVCAASDGTVENIFSNALGEGISLSHSGGFVTKYMCLGAVEDLKTGDTVKAGDVIGTVGKSKGENTKEPHLHFEMYKNNAPADPAEYLK